MRAYYENVLLEQREEASNQRLAEAEKARKALEEALEEARIAHEAELRAVLQRSSQLSPAGDGRSGKLKAPVATESAGQAPTLQAAESDFGAGTSGDTAAADIFVPNNGPASEAPASPALTIPGHSSARTKDAQRKRPREDGRTSDRASGTKTPLDRHQDIERVLVDKPNQKLFYRIGKADTGGSACDEILSKAFVPIDPNMVHLRGSTYAAARRVVLFERGRNGEEVVLAAAVIRLQTKHLEVLILVVAKPERKKGYGRILVEALTQVGREDSCTLLVAWASPDSKDFWPKVEMFEKGAADSSLKSAIMEYQQAESTIGFSGSKMVAKLIKI
jgi:GNAT superfamily N-acetyltransferase